MKFKLMLGATVAAVAIAAPAQASITVGSNLQGSTNFGLGCGPISAPCDATFSIQSLDAANQAPGGATVPSAGVIVGWRLRHGGLFTSSHGTASGSMTTRLRVIRGRGASGVGFAAGPVEALPQVPGTYTFGARLSVRAGDRIGYDLSITPGNLFLDGAVSTPGLAANVLGYSSIWPEGSSPSFYTESVAASGPAALLVSATIENDADNDGFGDESQDACPNDAQRQVAPCVSQPPSAGSGPPDGGGPLAFGDQTLVTLKLAAKRIPATGPARLRVANANSFRITGKLSGSSLAWASSTAKEAVKLSATAFMVAATAKKVVKLKLPRAMRKLLKRQGKLSLRLTAKVTDPAGNTRTVNKRVTLALK